MLDRSWFDGETRPVAPPLLRSWMTDEWLRHPQITAALTLFFVVGALFALLVEFQALVAGGPRVLHSTVIADPREPCIDYEDIPDPDPSVYDPDDARTWSAAQLAAGITEGKRQLHELAASPERASLRTLALSRIQIQIQTLEQELWWRTHGPHPNRYPTGTLGLDLRRPPVAFFDHGPE